MFFFWLTGRIGTELDRAGVREDGSVERTDAG
jgi:hypothetical protein